MALNLTTEAPLFFNKILTGMPLGCMKVTPKDAKNFREKTANVMYLTILPCY